LGRLTLARTRGATARDRWTVVRWSGLGVPGDGAPGGDGAAAGSSVLAVVAHPDDDARRS